MKKLVKPQLSLLLVLMISLQLNAQERPPRPILVEVVTTQHLQFGTFIQAGSSGTVTVDYNGARTAGGSVILPNINALATTPALFKVDAEPGTLIHIVNGPDATLSGSNTGTLLLKLGDSNPHSPFITKSQYTYVSIGGTLTVGPLTANPAGSYIGYFQVTFIQE